eukprot:GHVN01015685.1.p1 GENE.GHVN01015685.1~~GHVN01015685.1.p1  ORF type:complete len:305 (-),score=24.72 GHVN01015685.1:1470-2360(-)
MATESVQKYLDFDFSDTRWQKYLRELYPQPELRLIEKYKRKWYKRDVDNKFEVDFDAKKDEPSSIPNAYGKQTHQAPTGSLTTAALSCLMLALGANVIAVMPFAPSRLLQYCMWLYLSGFGIKMYQKYGRPQFKTSYWQHVIQDLEGRALLMAVVIPVLPPMSASPGIVAMLNVADGVTGGRALPPIMAKVVSYPIVNTRLTWVKNNRNSLLTIKGNVELSSGILAIVLVLTGRVTLVAGFVMWNGLYLQSRFDPHTQMAFRRLDEMLMKYIFGAQWCPVMLKGLYARLRESVSPE